MYRAMPELPPPSAEIPRPDPNTYWVKPGCLLAGEYPYAANSVIARAKLEAYLDAGINTFIDLTHPHELRPYSIHLPKGVEYRRIPVRDMSVPPHARYMTGILDTIDHALAAGRRVYVHCWGGVGRTGTVVGCWLQRHGREPEAALQELAGHWATVAKSSRVPRSPETDEQIAWVRRWPQLSATVTSTPEENW